MNGLIAFVGACVFAGCFVAADVECDVGELSPTCVGERLEAYECFTDAEIGELCPDGLWGDGALVCSPRDGDDSPVFYPAGIDCWIAY